MGLSIPSEGQLADAIQALKPGSFERLVEAYLRAKEPHRFRDLSIIGRNPDDVTRQGWPDTEVRRADGRIDAIEITHSSNWRQHLRADLLRIQELGGRIASFLFVAWADAPSREEEQTWREHSAAYGIPLQEVTFLFRKQLLFDLSAPRYARLWADPLGLPLTSLPFVTVDAAYQLFGSDDDPAHFRPSRGEFRDGRVYRPQLQDTVEQLLKTTGWAFLRGRGASGKTTMATSIAMSRADRPVYYIDLTDWDAVDESRAIDTLLTRADDQVLFVIDNVHLEPEFTRRLFDIWYNARNGSHLLLLGRATTPRPPHRGHAHPLRDLEAGAVDLLVQSPDLLGVYRRLLRRIRPNEATPQTEKTWGSFCKKGSDCGGERDLINSPYYFGPLCGQLASRARVLQTEPDMKIPQSVAEILKDHVTLEVESIDRMYLNVYVPQLQREGGIACFLRHHRGHRFVSRFPWCTQGSQIGQILTVLEFMPQRRLYP